MASLVSGGTISVSASSTSVVGVGTAFVASHVGAVLFADGLSVPIASVESATALTLSQGWPGTTLSAADYDLLLYGPTAGVAADNQQKVQELLAALSLKGEIHYVTSAPSSGLGDDGDTAINTTTMDFYRKASGTWSVVWTGTITSPDVSTLTVLTQAAYDALSSKDANTLYAITAA